MPLYSKHILCLANSQKMSGRCIAGKEISDGQYRGWVRPVSARQHQEISDGERRYADNSLAGLLDVVTIRFVDPVPGTYQSENHLIDANERWIRGVKANYEHVIAAIDNVTGPLWLNAGSSTHGLNDQIPEGQAAQLQHSLVLIRPTNLEIHVATEGYFWRKRVVRAAFRLNDIPYKVVLTDVLMKQNYLNGPDGVFAVPDAALCISLGEPFKGHVYKLAAALITPERVTMNDV